MLLSNRFNHISISVFNCFKKQSRPNPQNSFWHFVSFLQQDLPSFTQSVHRFTNDMRYYRQINSSLPAGSVTFWKRRTASCLFDPGIQMDGSCGCFRKVFSLGDGVSWECDFCLFYVEEGGFRLKHAEQKSDMVETEFSYWLLCHNSRTQPFQYLVAQIFLTQFWQH